jgi:hypothetical protein
MGWWGPGPDDSTYGITLHQAGMPDQFIPFTEEGWNLDIDDGIIIWEGFYFMENREIFIYQDSQVTQLTDNAQLDRTPVLDDGLLCWIGKDELTGHDQVMTMYVCKRTRDTRTSSHGPTLWPGTNYR